jgi:hypothetical protein
MKLKKGLILSLAVCSVFIIAGLVFSQDQPTTSASAMETQNAQQEPQWVWAEVLSLDPVNNQMTVKYLDYETDTEKEMTISTDNSTTYENINSLSEIKPQDTVSIDYITTAQGQNVAKNINVEKSEDVQPIPSESIKAAPEAQTETAASSQTAVNPSSQEAKPQTNDNPAQEQSTVPEKQE